MYVMMLVMEVACGRSLVEDRVWRCETDLLIINVLFAREMWVVGVALSQSWVRPSLTCRGWWQLVFRSTYSPSLGTGTETTGWNRSSSHHRLLILILCQHPNLALALIWGGDKLIAASLVDNILIRRGNNGRIWKILMKIFAMFE